MTSPAPWLRGKTCLVTGATNGIGLAAAVALAREGARLVLLGRDAERCEAARAEVAAAGGSGADVSVLLADLAVQADVRRAAAEFLASGRPLHVLLNNAGVVQMERSETADGIETTFAVNHLAPFLLTNLLLDRLKAGKAARVVTVSSMAHRSAVLDFDDLQWERRTYRNLAVYSATKLANILFTLELSRRLEGSGVTANCLHPGVVATNIFPTIGGFGGKLIVLLFRPLMLSPTNGAKTSVYLASSPEVANVTGKFFDKCREVAPAAAAQDGAAAKRLWEISEKLTGLGRK